MSEAGTPRVLMVFADGVGLGLTAPANPISHLTLPAFERLSGGRPWTQNAVPFTQEHHIFAHLDATLGMPGLPQSGTGQATLFTGVNCVKLAGRHFGPYPHSANRSVIADLNLFKRIAAIDGMTADSSAFANAYPERFFRYIRERRRWTVTTLCCHESGIKLRGPAELASGEAVAADITGAGWQQIGYDFKPLTEEQAAHNFVQLARRHHFTLFEYYLTDKAGHSMSASLAEQVLYSLDRFLNAILDRLDLSTDLLILTSDHGNLEDLSRKVHTINPVPFIAYGRCARHFEGMESIQEVTPRIVELIESAGFKH